MSKVAATGARTRARELLLQALYQKQIAGHDSAELLKQFREQTAYKRVDHQFFDVALPAICDAQVELEKAIEPHRAEQRGPPLGVGDDRKCSRLIRTAALVQLNQKAGAGRRYFCHAHSYLNGTS